VDRVLLIVAAGMQLIAVIYGIALLSRRQGATGAWLCLLGAMLSMLAWRLFVVTGYSPPSFFNPLIAIWGSTFMFAAMFLFGREVLQRRMVESERDALLASERAARVEAEQASRAKDEFLATLSHELRSPLSAILGWCAVLQHGRGAPAELARGLDVIERNARAQTRLVDELLDVTRMRTGTLHLDLEPQSFDQPVWSAVQAARPRADAKGVTLEYERRAPPVMVMIDADRMEQVVNNLLVNAIKFTPTGGRVTVTVRSDEDTAELVVADTGEGIDPEFLPHVFTPFRQADSSTARRHGGLGLGLSIVDNLVRLHGGSVQAESAGVGQGTRVTVRLPVSASTEATVGTTPRSATMQPMQITELAGVRAVVVDDEADVRSAVARLLEQAGASVVCLASGTNIVEVLVEHRPHVLVFDLGMPGEDGYSLIRRVRGLPTVAGGATPAISLTAHARSEDRARALAAGFNEHLPKPIEVQGLVQAIRELAACSGVSVTTAANESDATSYSGSSSGTGAA
jgi:signal transduction histidine kinase/CheY-like chemotaxis protein